MIGIIRSIIFVGKISKPCPELPKICAYASKCIAVLGCSAWGGTGMHKQLHMVSTGTSSHPQNNQHSNKLNQLHGRCCLLLTLISWLHEHNLLLESSTLSMMMVYSQHKNICHVIIRLSFLKPNKAATIIIVKFCPVNAPYS